MGEGGGRKRSRRASFRQLGRRSDLPSIFRPTDPTDGWTSFEAFFFSPGRWRRAFKQRIERVERQDGRNSISQGKVGSVGRKHGKRVGGDGKGGGSKIGKTVCESGLPLRTPTCFSECCSWGKRLVSGACLIYATALQKPLQNFKGKRERQGKNFLFLSLGGQGNAAGEEDLCPLSNPRSIKKRSGKKRHRLLHHVLYVSLQVSDRDHRGGVILA